MNDGKYVAITNNRSIINATTRTSTKSVQIDLISIETDIA